MTLKVHFRKNQDDEVITADANVGDCLLDIAQACGQPLEGTCEGQMACSTCHVIVDAEWFKKLKPAVEMEEDMLDLATDVRPTSRLACQIILDESLDGLTVEMPLGSRNMMDH